ncbi:MAG: SO_0444 family Cu/Zn efflux transporter [Thermodesulfobacteriota bacterium]
MELIYEIINSFVWFLMEASFFMLLGLFFAGILKAFLPDNLVQKHIGAGRKGGIFKASAFGVPVPLCSCGVVPAAAGIRKQGAGKGPVVSFLVSTPETGVDSIAITWALLGPVMAVIRPVSAFLTALFTGTLVNIFDKDENKELTGSQALSDKWECSSGCCTVPEETNTFLPMENDCGCSDPQISDDSKYVRFKKGMHFSFVDLVEDIAGWFIVGVLFAAVIAVFVTPEMVNAVSAKSPLLVMLLMLLISVPLYVCATSSTPIAAAFLMTGISPGAALVFLLAGPATNAASFSVISSIIGKKSAFIYLAGIIFSSLILGLGTDYIFSATGYELAPVTGETEEGIGFFVQIVSTIILSGFLVYPFFKKILNSSFFKK